jgi:hypothetical protein
MTLAQIVKEKLKNAVRYFYDIQMLRMQSKGRSAKKAAIAEAHLDEDDKAFLDRQGKSLKAVEGDALKEVTRLLKGVPIYEQFLKNVRGVGPTLSGVLIAEFNIEPCDTVSKMWAWSGLHTQCFCAKCDTLYKEPKHEKHRCPNCGSSKHYHRAARPIKGQKLDYNPWLKAKLLKVLGDCLIKVCSLDENGYYLPRWVTKPTGEYPVIEEDPKKAKPYKVRVPYEEVPYRKFFDDYKRGKENTTVSVCMGCKGTGKVTRVERDKEVESGTKKPRKKSTCPNCEGTGGPAPWGASPAHRKAAANRYMVKMFLRDLWEAWREIEGLEVRPPYTAQYGRDNPDREAPSFSRSFDEGVSPEPAPPPC